ncbi:MAG: hypothetical protein IJ341_02105 [Bacteroidales bacterium]|nr:hypothetical protein [Bacteroidales bacterium]
MKSNSEMEKACYCVCDLNNAHDLHKFITTAELECKSNGVTFVGGVAINNDNNNEIKLCTLMSLLADDIDGVSIIYTLNLQSFISCFNMYSLFYYAICYGDDIILRCLETGESYTLREAALAFAPDEGKEELNNFMIADSEYVETKKDIQLSSSGVQRLLDEIFRVKKTGFVFVKLNSDTVEFTADELWHVAYNFCTEYIDMDLLGLAIVHNNLVLDTDMERVIRASNNHKIESIAVVEFLKDPFADGEDVFNNSNIRTVDLTKLREKFPHKELLRRVINKIVTSDSICVDAI